MEILNIINELNSLNFTAIDLEMANEKRNSICSIGLVTVKNGIIINKKHFYVKPKEFRFTEINKRIHGISENDVMEAPEFNTIWKQFNSLIENQILLAHNCEFDIDALKQTLSTYNLPRLSNHYICTHKLAQESFPALLNYRLSDVALFLGLHLTHHDSVSDATVAAEIGIKAIPIFNKNLYNYGNEELTYLISKKSSAIKTDNYVSSFNKKKIDKNQLSPNLESANKNNLFYNKKIVFTGDLKNISRQEAAIKVQSLGGDVNTAISSKTNIVIVGNSAGPSKMKKIEDFNCKGCSIIIVYEDEFLELLKL